MGCREPPEGGDEYHRSAAGQLLAVREVTNTTGAATDTGPLVGALGAGSCDMDDSSRPTLNYRPELSHLILTQRPPLGQLPGGVFSFRDDSINLNHPLQVLSRNSSQLFRT